MDGITGRETDLLFSMNEFHFPFQHENELLPGVVEENPRFFVDGWEFDDEGFDNVRGTETGEGQIGKAEIAPSPGNLFTPVPADDGATFLFGAVVLKKGTDGHPQPPSDL